MAQTETQSSSPNAPITDDAYIGTLANPEGFGAAAGMTCTTVDFSGSAITSIADVTMDLALTHTWLGDITAKAKSPAGTIVAFMVRPAGDGGSNPPDDTGADCCGDSDNLTGTPVTFDDDAATSAEQMGLGGNVTGPFSPNNDVATQNAGSFSAFAGESAVGLWEVCVGDGAGGDLGTFNSVSITVTGGGGGCQQELSATLDDDTPAPGQIITFAVTITNNDSNPAPLDLWLDATGPISRTVRLGHGTVPGGATVSRNVRVRVPGGTPNGSYLLDLNIGTFSLDVCDTETFTVVVGPAPRVENQPEMTKEQALALEGTHQAAALAPDVTFEVVNGFFDASAVSATAAVSPNPFARQTQISYEVAATADVRLAVYDVLGREVAVLVDGRQEAGTHTAVFDARGLAAGTYVYRLVVGNDVQTGRMTLAF